jgi:hypothetical protein
VTFGASRRSAAVGIKRTELAGQPDELTKADGFWLYSVTMSDYLPQNYLGSGAKMSRTSGGAVSAVGTSLSVFPTNYFTTTVMATTDITVDPANAKFTVSVEGWYEVKLHVAPGASLATGEIFYTFLLKNGTAYEVGQYIAAGSTRQDIIEGNWTVYLVPGDYVQAGYQISITTASYFGAGDASSLYSLFNITLMNRSLV